MSLYKHTFEKANYDEVKPGDIVILPDGMGRVKDVKIIHNNEKHYGSATFKSFDQKVLVVETKDGILNDNEPVYLVRNSTK